MELNKINMYLQNVCDILHYLVSLSVYFSTEDVTTLITQLSNKAWYFLSFVGFSVENFYYIWGELTFAAQIENISSKTIMCVIKKEMLCYRIYLPTPMV